MPARVRVLGKKELFKLPVLGTVMKMGGFVPVDRSNREAAIASVTRAAEVGRQVASELETPAGGPELVIASGLGRAEKVLEERLSGTEVVLLKASRGVAMERLVPALEARFGASSGAGESTGQSDGENGGTGPLPASGGGSPRHLAGKEV